ncbi:uncharacterized protein TNCV_3349661 [Trichonephila clavipes]|nr:uncharacterized protein TNCV_3349661 [Trichonephila clavipes]
MALSGSLPQINLGVQERSEVRVGNPGDIKTQREQSFPLTGIDRKIEETRGNIRYTDNSRPRREFNRFENQGVAENQRFDGRRRGGQSDHRFHNQGGRQGNSRNSAFKGQNDRNRYLNF